MVELNRPANQKVGKVYKGFEFSLTDKDHRKI